MVLDSGGSLYLDVTFGYINHIIILSVNVQRHAFPEMGYQIKKQIGDSLLVFCIETPGWVMQKEALICY